VKEQPGGGRIPALARRHPKVSRYRLKTFHAHMRLMYVCSRKRAAFGGTFLAITGVKEG
jgi:hypothetical protein